MFRTLTCAAVLALAVQIPAFAAATDNTKDAMKGHSMSGHMSGHMKGSMKGHAMKSHAMSGHMKGQTKDKGHM